MTRTLAAAILAVSMIVPAYAQNQPIPPGATGGPSGGPNQSQSVVPEGATGGRSGGPNQSQYVKKTHKSHKKHH
jgi:hypothetical protein